MLLLSSYSLLYVLYIKHIEQGFLIIIYFIILLLFLPSQTFFFKLSDFQNVIIAVIYLLAWVFYFIISH